MSGRRREGLTPTLFPFLAVLVCTLGTLILLLAMVAQNAGEAIAASESRPTPPATPEQLAAEQQAEAIAQAADQVDRQLREAQWYREQTVNMRDQQTAELEQRRDRLAHLEDHLRRLRQQLSQLNTEIERTLEQKGDAHSSQMTLDQLLTQIEAEKQTIGKLEGELQSRTPRIVIVPHQGPNGTDRRPIYIQCRRDGVYLQPGGQRIARADLEPLSGAANPLDAALRTIRHHALQTYGDAIAPYPLLVVSPEGIETYAVARAAMSHWDDQFGYELIAAETELAFPAADPVLDDKVAAAIRQAVAQRESLALRSGGSGRGYGRGDGGGYLRGPGQADEQADGPTGSAAGHADRLAGDTATAAGPPAGSAGEGSSLLGDASGGGSASPPAAALPVLSAAQMSRGDLRGVDGARRGTGPGSRNAAGYSGEFGEYTGGSRYTDLADSRSSGTAGGATAAERQAAAEAGRRMDQQDQLGGQWTAQPQSPLAATTPGQPTDALAQPTDALAQPSSSGGGGESQSLTLNAAQTASGPSAANGSTAAQPAGAQQTGTQAAGSQAAGSQQSGAQAAGSQAAGSQQSGAQAAGSQAAGAQQPGSSAGDASDPAQPPGGSPSVSFRSSSTPPVTRVGKDWGLPSSLTSSRGTEMLRMIRVECYADRFVLLPEGGRGSATVFGFDDGDVNRASLELATAVRDRAAAWGAAMQGARWQPVLDVAVVSGGEARYQQLLRLMDGSGVKIQARGTR